LDGISEFACLKKSSTLFYRRAEKPAACGNEAPRQIGGASNADARAG
jgi:hypothetical protein